MANPSVSDNMGPDQDHNYLWKTSRKLRRMYDARGALRSAKHTVVYEECEDHLQPDDFDDRDFCVLTEAETMVKIRLLRLYDAVDAHITAYAAPRCFALCRMLQEKLSKELRDLVYTLLFPTKRVNLKKEDVDMDKIDSSKHFQPYFHSLPKNYLYTPAYRQLFDARFACATTRADFGDAWYRIQTFSFSGLQHINSFLKHDQWRWGIDPAQTVRSIVISTGLYLQQCNEHPQALSRLRPGLTIVFSTFCMEGIASTRDKRLEHIQGASLIFPIMKGLLESGYIVSVEALPKVRFHVKVKELTAEHWVEKTCYMTP